MEQLKLIQKEESQHITIINQKLDMILDRWWRSGRGACLGGGANTVGEGISIKMVW